jgi:hypothetical protein
MSDLSNDKLFSSLLAAASEPAAKDEIISEFLASISQTYGIDKVEIKEAEDGSTSEIIRHISSTRKPYTDNNLSEYSLFSSLISYNDKGYKSYAAVPILKDGKVTSIIEMLSRSENKFTEGITEAIASAAILLGLAISYKLERQRSAKLAEYFDAVFNDSSPQMLVTPSGVIAKANKTAMKEFHMLQNAKIETIIGINYEQLIKYAGRGPVTVPIQIDGNSYTYTLVAEKAGNSLTYLSLKNSTEASLLRAAKDSIEKSDYVAIIFTDTHYNITATTSNCEAMLGYREDMLIGKSISDLVQEKKRKEFDMILSAKLKQQIKGRTELTSLTGYPINMRFYASEMPQGFAFTFVNSDAEKYVEGLKESLQDFLYNASELVIKTDEAGRITYCNMAAENMLGFSASDMIGKEIKFIYKDPSIIDRDIGYARSSGKPDNTYVDLLKNDGTIVPGTQSTRLFRDNDGNIEFVIVVKELLTKRIMEIHEQELVKNAKEMKDMKNMSDLKSQFIYNISHELKTPLTNINGFSKLLYSGDFGELNEDQKQYIKTIADEANRLMLIIQQVLDASKLEASKVKLEMKEVDMSMFGENPSIVSLREAALEKGLTFDWKADYNVPTIMADPNRLIQIFVNLIGNSIKFTSKGGINVHIFKASNRKIQCDVKDTGIGISEEDRRKLFKKFYQVQKGLVKQDGAGTGLGLSITRELIRLHGGDISIKSEVGKGSTFSVTLPIKPRRKKRQQ